MAVTKQTKSKRDEAMLTGSSRFIWFSSTAEQVVLELQPLLYFLLQACVNTVYFRTGSSCLKQSP